MFGPWTVRRSGSVVRGSGDNGSPPVRTERVRRGSALSTASTASTTKIELPAENAAETLRGHSGAALPVPTRIAAWCSWLWSINWNSPLMNSIRACRACPSRDGGSGFSKGHAICSVHTTKLNDLAHAPVRVWCLTARRPCFPRRARLYHRYRLHRTKPARCHPTRL